MRKKNPFLLLAVVIVVYAFLAKSSHVDALSPRVFTDLTSAAAYDQLARLHTLLAQGVDVNEKDYAGLTALYRALSPGNFAVVKALISRGADVNTRRPYDGFPPLIDLVYTRTTKKSDILNMLIYHGAKINIKDNKGHTALFHYIRYAEKDDDFEPIKILIDNGADVNTEIIYKYENVKVPFFVGATEAGHEELVKFMIENVQLKDHVLDDALVRSAERGHIGIVKILLAHGADVEAKGKYGKTAMWSAAQQGHGEVVKTLLARGADVNARDTLGRTALMLAEYRRQEIDAYTRRRRGGGIAAWSKNQEEAARRGDVTAQLLLSVKRGEGEKVKTLLAHEADVNARDDAGGLNRTALMWAAWGGPLAVVEALLAHGADVNAKDRDGATALGFAIGVKKVKVVKLLLDKGADINVKSGPTPLFIRAAEGGDSEIVSALLDRGANVNERSKIGKTALIRAAEIGHREVVEVLLAHGAQVHAKADGGQTALMKGAEKGHAAVVDTLLAHGAQVNAKADGGQTALIISAKRGHFDITKTLLAKGADVNTKSPDGWTALMIAALTGAPELVSTLIAQGADVNVKDENANTALRVAEFYNEKKIAQLLRKAGAIE